MLANITLWHCGRMHAVTSGSGRTCAVACLNKAGAHLKGGSRAPTQEPLEPEVLFYCVWVPRQYNPDHHTLNSKPKKYLPFPPVFRTLHPKPYNDFHFLFHRKRAWTIWADKRRAVLISHQCRNRNALKPTP